MHLSSQNMSYWFPFRTETAEHLQCHCCLFLNDQVIRRVKAPVTHPHLGVVWIVCSGGEPSHGQSLRLHPWPLSETLVHCMLQNAGLLVTESVSFPSTLPSSRACARETSAHPKWTQWITLQCRHNNGFQSRHKHAFPELAELGHSSNTNSKVSVSSRDHLPRILRVTPAESQASPLNVLQGKPDPV